MTEQWRPVPDFPGYEVSDHGQVRSYWAMAGNTCRMETEPQRISAQPLNHLGYPTIRLGPRNSRHSFLVHRLVAQAFITKPADKTQINHKDGNKTNNHISNLEWVTGSENLQHAYDNGFRVGPKGGRNGRSKLTNVDVQLIRLRYDTEQITQWQLARKYGVHPSTISDIVRRQTWTHVPDRATLSLPENHAILVDPSVEYVTEGE